LVRPILDHELELPYLSTKKHEPESMSPKK
jgi:hypothetical protein